MTEAAEALEFEKAARLRDRISALSAIQGEQSVNPRSVPEADVFAIAEEAGHFCVEAFFFRTYQNWGNRAYFPRADRALSAAEVLDAFLAQFYLDRPAPRLVLLSHDVPSAATLCEILSARAGHRIAIGAPQARREEGVGGERAAQRARGAFAQAGGGGEPGEAARRARARLSAWRPRRAASRSTTIRTSWATNAIGAMIVAGPEGFVKNQYRTFNIKSAR